MLLLSVARAAGGIVGCLLAALLMVAAASVSAAGTPRQSADTPDLAAIDRYIEQEMAATRLPGLAIGVIQGDEVVHLRGFGRADSSGRAVTPETLFTIGSTGKSITALATMQLVEAGKIDLDAPVSSYLPEFRTGDPAGTEQITVRHLLTHTSGYSSPAGLQFATRENRGPSAVEEQIRTLQQTPLRSTPGERHEYSNANYIWLGWIVEQVSGQPIDQYLREHILEPLDMKMTALSLDDAEARGLATGHHYWFGRPVPFKMPYHHSAMPAGFIHSNAEEMSHYLIAHINGGEYRGRRVLSAEGIELLHAPHALARPATTPDGKDAYYGFGWVNAELNGIPMIFHGGSTGTFHANLVLLPERELAFVLLMNGENGLQSERITSLFEGVTSLLVGNELPPPPSSSGMQKTIFGYLLIAILIQLGGMGRSIRRLLDWLRHPARRPTRSITVARPALLSFVLNGAWALVTLRLIPALLGGSLRFQQLFAPDFGYTLLLTGGMALAWALIHPALLWWIGLRRGSLDLRSLGGTPRWGFSTVGAWRRGRR